MAAKIDLSGIVAPMPGVAPPISIKLPGGVTLSSVTPKGGGSALDQVRALMGTAGAAMAPLSPVFDLIGTVVAIVEFAKSIPKLLTEPKVVIENLEALVEKAAKLLKLVPQLSVPIMVLSIVDAVLALLDGMTTELLKLVEQQERIAKAKALVGTVPALQQVVAAAEARAAAQQASIMGALGAIGPILELVNTFISLVPGMKPIALGGAGEGGDVGQVIKDIAGLVQTLKQIRQAIPLP